MPRLYGEMEEQGRFRSAALGLTRPPWLGLQMLLPVGTCGLVLQVGSTLPIGMPGVALPIGQRRAKEKRCTVDLAGSKIREAGEVKYAAGRNIEEASSIFAPNVDTHAPGVL